MVVVGDRRGADEVPEHDRLRVELLVVRVDPRVEHAPLAPRAGESERGPRLVNAEVRPRRVHRRVDHHVRLDPEDAGDPGEAGRLPAGEGGREAIDDRELAPDAEGADGPLRGRHADRAVGRYEHVVPAVESAPAHPGFEHVAEPVAVEVAESAEDAPVGPGALAPSRGGGRGRRERRERDRDAQHQEPSERTTHRSSLPRDAASIGSTDHRVDRSYGLRATEGRWHIRSRTRRASERGPASCHAETLLPALRLRALTWRYVI